MLVGLFQYDIIWEDKEKNKSKILSILNESRKNFDWLVFPEMTLTGFSMEAERTVLSDFDIEFFRGIAIMNNCYVTFGGNVKGENTSLTLNTEGVIVSDYKKSHLFSFAGENQNYKSGTDVRNFLVNDSCVLPAICYDLRFSYHFWNQAQKTQIYCVIANWPESRKRHWRTLLCARAIENQSYVVAVNRVGADPSNNYSGNSMIIDPLGEIICEVENEEGIFPAEITKTKVAEIRQKFQFIKDRRL